MFYKLKNKFHSMGLDKRETEIAAAQKSISNSCPPFSCSSSRTLFSWDFFGSESRCFGEQDRQAKAALEGL